MKANINLPGQKIIMTHDYKNEKEILLFPIGLMISIKSLELTAYKKRLKLSVIRNKKIIDNLYEDIPKEKYVNEYTSYNGHVSLSSLSYILENNNLQHFLNNAKYKAADAIYEIILKLPNNKK